MDLQALDGYVTSKTEGHEHDMVEHMATPAHVTLTTDHVTADDVGPLVAALHAAGVTVERHTFLPVRGEEQHPWGVLLMAASGPPLPLARLVVPATAPAGVALALAAALGVGGGSVRRRPRSNSRPSACLSLSGAVTLST